MGYNICYYILSTNTIGDYTVEYPLAAIIYSDSTIHLVAPNSLQESLGVEQIRLDLNSYPDFLANGSIIKYLTFVFSKEDPASWKVALKIAEALGSSYKNTNTRIKVMFVEDFNSENLAADNVVLVGYPSNLPILKEIERNLPISFEQNSNLANESKLSISYRIPSDMNIGYIELLGSPWNTRRILLGVFGNSNEGIDMAGNALSDPDSIKKLSGNFAIVSKQQIYTVDTRKTINLTP
jgi:hypothetical protein